MYAQPRPFRRFRYLVALVALSLPAAGSAQAGPEDRFEGARTVIRQLMDERAIPSVAVAASQGGHIVWEEGFGWADRERRIRATSRTLYSLASISKPITATGLMVLAQRGRAALDRPANDYLGASKLRAMEGDADDATLRRLLSHTAGLPLHYRFFYEDRPPARPTMDETIARYGILVTPPGTLFEYSNLGFGILDQVIERTAGIPYEEFMRREVFAPLGLTGMSVLTGPEPGDLVARRYDPDGARIPWYDFDHRGASAVYSSAHDLARFGMFHLKDHLADQQRILPDSVLDTMHQALVRRAEDVGYGLGWQTFTNDHGFTSLGHSGGMPGVSTLLRIYPETDVAVVVLLNTSDGGAMGRMAEAVAAALMPRYADHLREADTRGPTSSEAVRFAPPPGLEGEWEGEVRSPLGVLALRLVVLSGGEVRATLGGDREVAVEDPRWRDGILSGTVPAVIPTPDVARQPNALGLRLRLHQGRLSGAVSALASSDRLYYALSSYATLTPGRHR